MIRIEQQPDDVALSSEFQINAGISGVRLGSAKSGFRSDPSEQHVVAFHGGNAIFNCWQYFREFIQSATARMGFPPLPSHSSI